MLKTVAVEAIPENSLAAQRFWKLVDKRGPDECWPWTGTRQFNGYGHISIDRWRISAHRLAYAVAKGSIPPALFVCHTCDNRICVNPSHLFLGTSRDNAQDALQKGRLHKPYEPGKLRPCRKGHPVTEENRTRTGQKSRCRTCALDYYKERYRRRCASEERE